MTKGDLAVFFEHQREPEANRMAAFAARDPDVFMKHWLNDLAEESIRKRSILVGGQLAGNIVSFDRFDVREVGYWSGARFWGRGAASAALREFLLLEPARPLYAGVVSDNGASLHVLQKCGFVISGQEREFSTQRGEAVTFVIPRLGAERAEVSG